jgi:hypothetical protein
MSLDNQAMVVSCCPRCAGLTTSPWRIFSVHPSIGRMLRTPDIAKVADTSRGPDLSRSLSSLAALPSEDSKNRCKIIM